MDATYVGIIGTLIVFFLGLLLQMVYSLKKDIACIKDRKVDQKWCDDKHATGKEEFKDVWGAIKELRGK